jgi:hypothetical protein
VFSNVFGVGSANPSSRPLKSYQQAGFAHLLRLDGFAGEFVDVFVDKFVDDLATQSQINCKPIYILIY